LDKIYVGLQNKLDATYKENTSWQTPRIIKIYRQKGSVARGRPMERQLDVWDRNESTSGPIHYSWMMMNRECQVTFTETQTWFHLIPHVVLWDLLRRVFGYLLFLTFVLTAQTPCYISTKINCINFWRSIIFIFTALWNI